VTLAVTIEILTRTTNLDEVESTCKLDERSTSTFSMFPSTQYLYQP